MSRKKPSDAPAIGEKAPERQIEILTTASDLERFENAISDIVCWLGGFTAAGKEYSPGTFNELQAIQRWMKRNLPDGPLNPPPF